MYCIKCGVELADTEKRCPLCDTAVFHPDIDRITERPLYPKNKLPKTGSNSKVLCGSVVIVFLIPLIVCFFADLLPDRTLSWFGFVAGALILAYTAFALPLWFKKPNPIIFVPCTFAAIAVYLLYINCATDGDWFLSFAFPITGVFCLIATAFVTLLRCLRRGRLYVFGGAFILFGLFSMLVELFLCTTFDLSFVGWSVYPLVALVLVGGLLIYLAINATAREIMKRKLFF